MFDDNRVYVFLVVDGERIDLSDQVPVDAHIDVQGKQVVLTAEDGQPVLVRFRHTAQIELQHIRADAAARVRTIPKP